MLSERAVGSPRCRKDGSGGAFPYMLYMQTIGLLAMVVSM